ncbi:MAG TPA: hypothetical protein VFR81_13270 [Longimicrobium sp.]|nr:hypothetical protein [Longimicrobium sp.]
MMTRFRLNGRGQGTGYGGQPALSPFSRAPILLLIALAACRGDEETAARAPGEPADGCRWGAAVDTAGWEVVDAGPFVFKVPPGFSERVATGVDSYVGTWVAGDRAIAFDYGPYTTDPRERADTVPGGWSCVTRVAGREAVVRAAGREVPAGPGRVVAHDVAEAWWREGGMGNHLLVIGWGPPADSAGRAAALAAIRSVRFRTAWSAADSLRQLHRFCRTLRGQAARDTTYRRSLEEWQASCPAADAPPPPPPDYESVR